MLKENYKKSLKEILYGISEFYISAEELITYHITKEKMTVKKKVTAAVAGKMLKTLEEERNYWQHVERTDSVYTVGQGEEPVVPEYFYDDVASQIARVNEKITKLRHAIQVHNIMSEIEVVGKTTTADMLQYQIEQLSNRKSILGKMRKASPVTRVHNKDKKAAPEFVYINYDLEAICEEYDFISEKLIELQTAYELFQQTALFEVEVEG